MKWNRLFYGPKTRLLVGRDWMSGNWGTFDLVICAVCTEPAYQVDAMVFVPCCWCRECIIIRIDIGQNGTQIWRERARNYPSLNMCVALCNWKLYALLRNQNKMFHLDGTRVPFTSFKKIQSSVFNEGLLEYHQLTCTHQMANIRANGKKWEQRQREQKASTTSDDNMNTNICYTLLHSECSHLFERSDIIARCQTEFSHTLRG